MCSLNPVRCDFCENELDEKDSIGFSLHWPQTEADIIKYNTAKSLFILLIMAGTS
jgi:hypothetical protein